MGLDTALASLRTRRRIFPAPFFGTASTNSTPPSSRLYFAAADATAYTPTREQSVQLPRSTLEVPRLPPHLVQPSLDLHRYAPVLLHGVRDLGLEHDVRARELARVLVGHADHRCVCHVWVAEEVALELGRGDLQAFHLDEVLFRASGGVVVK